jgi:malic enzyme
MAALFNALKIVGKPIEELRVLVVGLGAAGVAVTKMMLASGVTHDRRLRPPAARSRPSARTTSRAR